MMHTLSLPPVAAPLQSPPHLSRAHQQHFALQFVAPDMSAGDDVAAPLVALRRVSLFLPDGRLLFNDINETFSAQYTGLIGANGVGKSLLAQVIAGYLAPDQGQVIRRVQLAYVPQNLAVSAAMTVADMIGMAPTLGALERVEKGGLDQADFDLLEGHWDMATRLKTMWESCGLADLSIHDLAVNLSAGERMKAVLGAVLASNAGMLLLDEPTNHLDAQARQWLREKLQQWAGGVVVLSHDRALLSDVSQIVELADGRLERYGGNYDFYKQMRDAQAQLAQTRLDQARQQKKRVQRELQQQHDDQLKQSSRQNNKAKTANLPGILLGRRKDSAQQSAGKNERRKQQEKERLSANVALAAQQIQEDASVLLMLPDSVVPAGKQVVYLDELVLPYGGSTLPLTMLLTGPVRVGITGPNGCGKTTLLKVIAGMLEPASGLCEVKVPTVWMDQTPESILPPGHTVLQQLQLAESPLSESQQRTQLAQLGLDATLVQLPAGRLSGGQWFKAALACTLWGKAPAQMLLMDEPTNHLDLWAIASLEKALRSFLGAMMVVSHDTSFLNALQLTHTLMWEQGAWRLEEV